MSDSNRLPFAYCLRTEDNRLATFQTMEQIHNYLNTYAEATLWITITYQEEMIYDGVVAALGFTRN